MAVPGIPTNFNVQTGNQQILVSWNLVAGAISYVVQRRSLDNVTYTTVATVSGTPLVTYLDTSVLLNTQYWYQVAAVNISGTGAYTAPQSAIPTPTGEMSLAQIRLAAQQRADRINSNFVTQTEWNSYINQSMYELYDLLITVYEDYFIAPAIQFPTQGINVNLYPLPNGSNTFTDAITQQPVTPPPFYKLSGVDLGLNSTQNAFITLNRFNFIDRNRYFFPNTGSILYGIFNPEYRVMGSNLQFLPAPTAGQIVQLWYIPRLPQLLQETDTTYIGISGWIEYVIVKAAYYALTKEESNTQQLEAQLLALTKRIEETAANRDAGQADKISNTRMNTGNGWGWGGGWNGPSGGY